MKMPAQSLRVLPISTTSSFLSLAAPRMQTLDWPSSSSRHFKHLLKLDSLSASPLLSLFLASILLPPATSINFLLLSSWKALPNPPSELKATDMMSTYCHLILISSGSYLFSHIPPHKKGCQASTGSTVGENATLTLSRKCSSSDFSSS